MNINSIHFLKSNIEKHIAECNDLLHMLENHRLSEKTPKKQKLNIKKIEGLIKYKSSQSVMFDTENSRFLELMNSIPSVAIQGYNKKREVVYWNKASEDIYGYTEEEALGKTIESLIIPDEMREIVIKNIADWYENGNIIPAGELTLTRKNKTPVHVFSSHVMLNKDTEQAEMFCVDVDLSEIIKLKVENETLEKKAHIDPLTSTYNRLYFESIIDSKLKETISNEKAFSLIMLDIDHFKKINDTYGHDIGDMSLKQLSTIVSASIRKQDMLFRWGGEEFMLLVEATLSEANSIANKLRETIALATEISDETPYFTCSFGIVTLQQFNCFDCAYKAVDEMLYKAKNNGRNRVECMVAT